jgi:hypothetical protein
MMVFWLAGFYYWTVIGVNALYDTEYLLNSIYGVG